MNKFDEKALYADLIELGKILRWDIIPDDVDIDGGLGFWIKRVNIQNFYGLSDEQLDILEDRALLQIELEEGAEVKT